jgi:homogentisate 1,2-dioxygenase
VFYNADGELLIAHRKGRLKLQPSWSGRGEPGEIAVIPRGVKFRAELPTGPRGILQRITAHCFHL